MPLADDEVKKIAYGVLNPGIEPNPTNAVPDPSTGGSMRAIKQAALKAYTPDARKGTGPYRGIVLMKLPDITGGEESPLPRNSWLNSYYGDTSSSETREQIPYPLQQYKVYIPELHVDLPRVKKYLPYSAGAAGDPEYKKIGMYPTFIARESDVEPAAAGDIVWVNFGNNETFEDPYYIGKVFSEPSPQPSDITCAIDALRRTVGGVVGQVAAGVASLFGANGVGPNPPTGEALTYSDEYRRLASANFDSVLQQFPNRAYEPYEQQNTKAYNHPLRSQAVGVSSFRQTSASANNCINCFQTRTPAYTARDDSYNGRAHTYHEGFVRYVESGGRPGTPEWPGTVSGRIGVGCVNHLPTYLERILLAQRLVAEDQSGRPYGWGCKHWKWRDGGIDCSGFTFLSRCMVELMMSSDNNFNGLENSRFTGWTGKGGLSEGNDPAAQIPSGTTVNLPWHSFVYGNVGRAMENRAPGEFGETLFAPSHGYSTPMRNAAHNYRRGATRCLVTINNSQTDPNTPWGTDSSHAPVMPGDIILTAGRNAPSSQNIPSVFSPLTPNTHPGQPHDAGHIVTTFVCPGGLLRTIESGGGGVKTQPFQDYIMRQRPHRSRGQNLFIYETEEMARAWSRCVDKCVEHGIPHANGRPLVPWSPELAKKLAPTLFENLQIDGWSETPESSAVPDSTPTAETPEGESAEPISSGAATGASAGAVLEGDIGNAINPETGEASTEVVRTSPNPTPEEGAASAESASTESPSAFQSFLNRTQNFLEGATSIITPNSETPQTPSQTTPPTGQTGTGGPTPAPSSGCSPGAGRTGGGRGGSSSGGSASGGPVTPNPAYQGEGVPASQPLARRVRVRFDNMRTDHCSGSGGNSGYLREDVANDLLGAKTILNELGGVLGTSGTGRGLQNYNPNNPNAASCSFHYTMLALDLYTWGGSLYPASDPNVCEYVITYAEGGGSHRNGGNRMFVVWARSNKPAGTEHQGHRVQNLTLDARVCPRGTRGEPQVVQVTGNFINLTELLGSFGFVPIPGRRYFFDECYRNNGGAEWWHFQNTRTVNRGDSWASVMGTIHRESRFRCSPTYRHRRRVFRNLGFSGRSADVAWAPCPPRS